jgi:hypothetical protein
MTDTTPNSGDRHDVQARVDEPNEPGRESRSAHPVLLLPATGWRRDGPGPAHGCRATTPSGRPCSEASQGRCCSSPTQRRSTGCSGSQSTATASTSRCYLDFDVIHDLRTILPLSPPNANSAVAASRSSARCLPPASQARREMPTRCVAAHAKFACE